MKNIFNKIAILSILFIGLSSCENDGYEDYTVKSNASVDLNGEWFIDITKASDGSVVAQHTLHKTFDSNDGKMYIDDNKNGYWLKGKLEINPTDLTFSALKEPNLLDPGTTFTITEGKITKGGGISKDGNVVDKIYFKAEFSYEPGVIYIHEGHKRSKFLEDEY
jgi:Lipid-binding putative hydrolase